MPKAKPPKPQSTGNYTNLITELASLIKQGPKAGRALRKYVLEFLDLKDEYSESQLEEALIRHLDSETM